MAHEDRVIERYIEQDTSRLARVEQALEVLEARVMQVLAEMVQLREMIEGALQMVMVVEETEKN